MKDTQIRKIENFCKVKTWITQRDAYKLGIYRLASRINDMHRLGYWIDRELITVENADGTKSRVARYRIVKTPDEVMHNVG